MQRLKLHCHIKDVAGPLYRIYATVSSLISQRMTVGTDVLLSLSETAAVS